MIHLPLVGKKTSDQNIGVDESDALHYLRNRIFRNTVSDLWKKGRLRLFVGLFCCFIFWVGTFVLFWGGFEFVETFKLTDEIYEYLFSLFFLTLFFMLGVSTGIIVYAGLYHGREVSWLMTQPPREDGIFVHKFVESIGFAGWGVLLLGSPVLVAYGLSVKAGIIYYLAICPLLVVFIGLPGSLGATFAILIGYIVPRRPKIILSVIGVILVVVLGKFIWNMVSTKGVALTPDWMDNLLGRLAFSRHPLLPSRWMAQAVVALSHGHHANGLFYFFVIASNAAMAYLIATWVSLRVLREGFCRAQGERSSIKRRQRFWLDHFVNAVFSLLVRPVKLLIIKDARCFLRDPGQWSQFMIFFGLLGAYFLNIRKFSTNLESQVWRNLVSYLNLSVTALLLATFTSRFIFPMMSLEGRNAWMLNLLPVRRSQILWGKFAFSASLSFVASESLLMISDIQLGLQPGLIAVHGLLMAIISLGLSAISVGLGARLANFRETDPSKIAAGFGGTLNLVVSLLFLMITIGAVALPCHLYYVGLESGSEDFKRMSNSWNQNQFQVWLGLGISISIIAGVLSVLIPIRMGLCALENQEF